MPWSLIQRKRDTRKIESKKISIILIFIGYVTIEKRVRNFDCDNVENNVGVVASNNLLVDRVCQRPAKGHLES